MKRRALFGIVQKCHLGSREESCDKNTHQRMNCLRNNTK